MKRVLSAGVILLAGVACLTASAQNETTPPASNQVAPQVKPKSRKKSGTTKTAKTIPAKSPAQQTTSAPGAAAATNAPNPQNAAEYYEVGMSHYQSKRFKDAVEAFKQSIRLGSAEPKTYFNLGQAYYSLGQYREAREAYKRAVRVKPDWAEAHYQLGWVYHILGDRDSALAQYKTLQTLDPLMAGKFQRLLDDDEKSALAARSNATGSNAANAKSETPESVPATTALDQTAASTTANTSSPAVTPDSTNQPAAPTETNTNSNGNSSNTSGSTGGTSVGADSTAAPAKDETAASEPAAETVAAASALPLTSVYRVGVGDVLDVRVLNTPSSRSTLFTVMSSGLIEYPLAGGTFTVIGLTTDEIGARLSAELKRRGLGDNAQVVVGVRDYTSHTVFISGLVNYPGTKILRREAVPLYVLIAEAQLRPDAGRAVVMRASESIPINDLTDPASLNVLVKAGDVITVATRQPQYYFIGGRINSPGQKNYQSGLTLIQAILAAGGLSRAQDSVEISREETDGRLTTTKYVLKEIKSGKVPDPRIQPGDRIEVGH